MRKGSALRAAIVLCLVVASIPVAATLRPATAQSASCAGGLPTTTVYLPNVTKTLGGPAGWVTPFYVQNTGTVQTAVEVAFFRFSDGAQVACRRTTGIAPGTSLVDNPNADADLPDGTQFSVVVKSFGAPVVAMVNQLQGSGVTQQALSYSGFTTGATTVYVPNVTRRFFGWDVPLIVQNLGAVPTSATATFTSVSSGSCAVTHAYAKAVPIDPGKSRVFDPDFEQAATAAPGSGLRDGCQYAVVVTSAQPVAVVANAHNEVGGASAYSHNGIAAGGTLLYAPYAVRSPGLFSPDAAIRAASLFSNVVIQNLGTAPVTATLTFTPLGATGAPQSFTLTAIAGGSSRPFDVRYASGDTAQPFCGATAAAGCLATGEYSLTISAPTAIAAVVLPVSATGAAGYLAAASATPRALVPAAFRTIGGASGWVTQLYLQSASATQATARWYGVESGDLGATQTLTLVPGKGATVDPRGVTGLAENTQYSVTIDANGPLVAIAFEAARTGGDASMIYEAFALPAQPATGQPGSIRLSPTSASVSTTGLQRFTAAVRDQYGVAMTAAAVAWTLAPPTLGVLAPSGDFTAGATPGTGTVTATSGSLSASATVTVVAPALVTVGGLSFSTPPAAGLDLFAQAGIPAADVTTITQQAVADVTAIAASYGRAFAQRPRVYVFATTSSFRQGLQSVLGLDAASADSVGASATGVYVHNATAQAIAVDWQKQSASRPITVIRHELTHWMLRQIVPVDFPTWFNEGNARVDEFAIPNGQHRIMQNRYGAASMAATNTLFTLAEMTDGDVWNARGGDGAYFQYYAAAQAVQLIRGDFGMAGVLRIVDRLAQGDAFEGAYATATGQSFATFSASYAARVRALAPAYPGIATATDTPAGPGLAVFVYGCTPGTSTTVSITGAVNNLPSLRPINGFGTYSFFLGGNWPAGAYTISVSGPGCTASTSAVKPASVFEASGVPDAGTTADRGALELSELPPGPRD